MASSQRRPLTVAATAALAMAGGAVAFAPSSHIASSLSSAAASRTSAVLSNLVVDPTAIADPYPIYRELYPALRTSFGGLTELDI